MSSSGVEQAASEYFWGPVTSTIDWCEENYVVNPYIAEFWNTLTNLLLILLSVFGLYRCWQLRLELRSYLSFIGALSVGLGSWAFHATLQYTWQLADELPMIWCTCVFVYNALESGRKPRFGPWLPIGLTLYAALFTGLYITTLRHPVFHQINYGVLVAVTVFGFYAQVGQLPPDERMRVRRTFLRGLLVFLAGFALWLLERALCDGLRVTRAALGPLAPLLQLHGFWHLLTGLGTYAYCALQAYVRARGRARPVRLAVWGGVLPDVQRARA